MWQAHPVGWLARTYAVEERGRPLATLEFGSWSERGALTLADERLEIVREGWWNPRFHLIRRARLATASRTSLFRSAFTIEHDGEHYTLGPNSWLGRSYTLSLVHRNLGEIRPQGFLDRRFLVELDEELAPELRLFAFWLVLLVRRRAAAAAAAAS